MQDELHIEFRSDKDVPAEKLMEFYRASKYNDWWTERNVRAMVGHCHQPVTDWNGGNIVESATVLSDGVNYAHIDDLVVHPSFRNRGIGTKLLEMALEKIRPLNLDFIQLIPVPGRDSFFEKHGFTIVPGHAVMEYSGGP